MISMINMYLALLFISFLLTITINSQAQSKVASYCIGKYGTSQYEHLGFWVKDGKRGEITYSYGTNPKDIRLQYLGRDVLHGDSCFKIRFPNGFLLYVLNAKTDLIVQDSTGTYHKTFSWEYEGPINGIGTFCDVCASDESDAMDLVKSLF